MSVIAILLPAATERSYVELLLIKCLPFNHNIAILLGILVINKLS